MHVEPETDTINNNAKAHEPSTKEHMQAEALHGSPTSTATSELSPHHSHLSKRLRYARSRLGLTYEEGA